MDRNMEDALSPSWYLSCLGSPAQCLADAVYPVIIIVLVAAVLYLVWGYVVPDWVKDKYSDAARELDEVIREMDKICQQEGLTDVQSGFKYLECHHAFTSLRGLNKESSEQTPDWRYGQNDDGSYDDGNKIGGVEASELAEYLDYSDWAYDLTPKTLEQRLHKKNLSLDYAEENAEPGSVGHYVATHKDKKLVIVALKGTSSWADVATDLYAIPEKHAGYYFDDETFAAPTDGNPATSTEMYCHKGIFKAAIRTADRLEAKVKHFCVEGDCDLVICGHSLGGGVACLVVLILRARHEALRENYTKLRGFAFGTPPVLSSEAAKACAPFVTSVVNHADVIPRLSFANSSVLCKLLAKVHTRQVSTTHTYNEHPVVDEDLLLTEQDFDDSLATQQQQMTDALFVPGRVVVMWDKRENSNNEVGGVVTDCDMKMLRQFELKGSFRTDHSIDSYKGNLERLLDAEWRVDAVDQ